MPAKTVTSTEFRARASRYLDDAAKAPIYITRHNRPLRVLIDYEEYKRLKKYDTRGYVSPADLTEAERRALDNVRVDPRYDHLDRLLD